MNEHQEAPQTPIEDAVFDLNMSTMGRAKLQDHIINVLNKESLTDDVIEQCIKETIAAYVKYCK